MNNLYRNHKIFSFLVLMVFLILGAAKTSQAQLSYYGVKGGTSFANISGDDVNFDTNTRVGIVLGAYAGLSFSDLPVTIQPEILYTQKGYKTENSGVTSTLKLNYIEVPILAKFSFETMGSVQPHVIAGPFVGINILSESSSGGTTQDLDSISSGEFGLAAGAGVNVSGIDITARYDLGITQIFEDDVDARNGAIMITAGYTF